MGAVLKTLAFLAGVSLLGLGGWALAVPLFLYSFWGLVFHRRTRPEPHRSFSAWTGGKRGVGAAFVAVSLLAFLQGGRLSVGIFGGAGLLLVFWDSVPLLAPGSYVRPVEESTLLRSVVAPWNWHCVVELKLLTRNIASVLETVDGPLIISVRGKTRIHVLFGLSALSYAQAARKAAEKAKGLGAALLPLGGYVVPLDSEDAAAAVGPLREAAGRVKDWRHALRTAPLDSIVLNPKGGFVVSMGLLELSGETGHPRVPTARRGLPRPPLLWEVAKAIEQRVDWPEPDDVTRYAASLGARMGIGPRGGSATGGLRTMQARAPASPPSDLKMTQLRALAEVYA